MHVAFILDGNRRYAKKMGIAGIEGHRRGLFIVRDHIVEACLEQGVQVLSLYCFSTENWKRSKPEVNGLMRLFHEMIDRHMREFTARGVAVRHIGRADRLPKSLLASIADAVQKNPQIPKLTVNVALDYGSQDEIVRAIQRLAPADMASLTPERFAAYLDTSGQPPVDLLIRTGGDLRISNFLLWQCAYAELVFLPQFLPQLTKQDVADCLRAFAERQRRFGT